MSTVDEVKARLDIVEVVGGYVRLQKSGRHFKAPCPFHNEKTPSFIVNQDRQSWHCFGACGTGGDVISFVAKKENLDFSGALRLLAERAGIEMRDDGPRRQEIKTLQDANEAAAVFYHGLLLNSKAALSYIEERGLDQKAVGDFLIGYAPAGWETLKQYLTGKGFSEQHLMDVGLLVESERGGYDRFRERLMFPIRDDRGRVLGLGGRVMPGAGQSSGRGDPGPKYVNTPQTPIFDKGSILYGLDRAKDDMRASQTAVIVEGYMDVIAAHQHGYHNVVASMGTALTDRQATLVQRFADKVVLAMDADEAGSAANLRAMQVVASAAERPRPGGQRRSLEIRVLALPIGKDPDEMIRHEPAAWTSAIDSAKPVVDHLIAVMSGNLNLAEPRDRSTLVAEVLPVIGEVADPVLQAHYLQRLSRLARVPEDMLRRSVPRRQRPRRGAAEGDESATPASAVIPSLAVKTSRSPREEYALALLYHVPGIAQLAKDMDEELFTLSENRELFRSWRLNLPVTEEDALWEHYQQILTTRVLTSETAQAEAAFSDCVQRLEQVRIRSVKEASALALAEGEAGVRPGQVASIARMKMGAGESEEATEDALLDNIAAQLLEDMQAGLHLHRRMIESSRSDHGTAVESPEQSR